MERENVIPIRPQREMSWPAFAAITVSLCAALFIAVFLSGDGTRSSAAVASNADIESASFGYCFGSVRRNCVVDGDTFWYESRKIRIADINTPEISKPGCAHEERLGQRARKRLHNLLNDGPFTLAAIDRDQDIYGRDLRIVMRGGESVGDVLVAEGLAEHWQGYKRDWC